MLMDAPRNVYVFRIHKEAFVKKPGFTQRIHPEEKETSKKIRRIELPVMVGIRQKIAAHTPAYPFFRQEPLGEDIERRREQPTGILELAVGVTDAWHRHSRLWTASHKTSHKPYDIAVPPYVGIHHKMVFIAVGHGIAYRKVVGCPEPSVPDVPIAHSAPCINRFGHIAQRIVRGIVHNIDAPDTV